MKRVDRRHFLRTAAAGAASLAAWRCGLFRGEAKRPNILFIMSDDHASSAIGAYGSHLAGFVETPHLDRLAAEGARLQNCFCTNSLCAPSRATILTGQYSHRNGVTTLEDALSPDQPSVAKEFQKNGYNINLEMNYWPSEVANLAECAEPPFAMIKDLAVTGHETARINWNARGWMLGHNTDLWRATAPIHGAYWGAWHTGGGWLCAQLWEHYLYSGDRAFLEAYYPVIKAAAEFFLDTIVPDPKTGRLVTNPSGSPENGPGGDPAWTRNPDGTRNRPIGIAAGLTMDLQIVGALFDIAARASEILGADPAFRGQVKQARAKLEPMRIGRLGQLQEWREDVDNPEDHHRHVSHLWGLYPGTSISPRATPKLAEAAKQTLKLRGDAGTGWSMAWKINFWARLVDGDHTWELVKRQLTLTTATATSTGKGGTYPNMLDTLPPFQIDGNLGGAAGIAEMLIQSHEGEICLLPALPAALPQGSFRGLRARGGFEVGAAWANGALKNVSIASRTDAVCKVRWGKLATEFKTVAGKTYVLDEKAAGRLRFLPVG